jgi:subtilisin-like proprotein convertase family protein
MLIRYIFLLVATFALAPASLIAQDCICTNCPQFMQDLFVGDFNINIQGASNPTLGQNGQAVCAVKVHFNHTALCDISITLTSPSGQTITLVGPIGQFCTNQGNTGTDWDVTFLPCGGGAVPDPGFSDTWNNNQPWGANNNYNGSYYPFAGCLQNFTGPVNGNWTLTVTDGQALDTGNLFDYEIIFCDPSGITCVSCVADAGALLQDDVEECQGDQNLVLSLPPTYQSPASPPPSGEYTYGYVISGNGGVIVDIADDADLTTLPAGNYSVCGISYLTAHENLLPVINGVLTVTQLTNQLNSNTPPFCGNISTNCVGVIINPIPADVEEIQTICAPACYDFLGSFYCQTGDYTVDQMDANGCHYNAILRLTVNAPSFKALTETVCPGTCSGNPNFPSACSTGLYQVTLMNAVGCDSTISLNLTIMNIDAVIQPPPVLSCAQPSAQLSGTGSTTGAGTTYLWSASNGGNISGANNLINATAAAPGNYRLVVCRTIGGASCCDTANVTVTSSSSLPNPPGIIGDTLICLGINQQYAVTPDPNANSYTWTVPNGVQIISGQGDSSIVVQWNNNIGGVICVTADNICGSSQANCINLQVTSAPPAPVLSGLPQVCKDSIAGYFAAPIAGVSNFDWQVLGGTLLSGQGTDTIQVRWDSLQSTGSVCAIANNTCGQGVQNCLQVNINSVPGLAQIQGDSLLCSGDTATYTFPALSTATGYSWTVPAGATILSGQDSTVLRVLWNTAPGGNVCVRGANGCGAGPQQCFPVTVWTQPVANAGMDTSLCGISVNLAAVHSVLGSTGIWTNFSGPGTATFSNDSLINSLAGVDSNGVYQFQWIENNGICSDPDTVQVAFNAAPQGGLKMIACDGTNQNYTISFPVLGGAAPYTIPGGSITNGIFSSDPIANGQSYAFSITDSNGCVSLAITGVFNCNCATNAGSMNQQPLTACPGNSVTAQAAQGSNLDADDTGAFVLHTGSGSSLGTILGENTTGIFSFVNGMVYGTTYYISFVVGNNLVGLPDLTDPCLSVAPGQPVIFYNNPIANAGQDISTCGLGLQVLGNAPAGSVLWSVTGTPAGANATIASPQNATSTITASTFGTYTLLLTVTNNGCQSTDAVQLNFNDSPLAGLPTLTCDGTNQQFTVNFDISAGQAPYTVNGLPVAGSSFTSASITTGGSYNFVITDGNGCTSTNLSGSFACNCATNAGQVSQTPISACQSDPISVQLLGGQTLDADDVAAFVLHTGSGAALGSVLAQNLNGTFVYGANLSFGTTYYVSVVAGNNLNGFPDPNDPCFSVSPGQPVVFLQNPVPNAGADIAICGLTTNMAAIPGLFPGIWTQVSGPNTANFSNNQSPSSTILAPLAGSYIFRWTQTNGICTAFDEVKVDFRSNPTVTALIPTCNATNTGYTLSFTVLNGSPNYSTTGLNGTFTGNTFNSALLPNNSSYSFVVKDAFGCPSPAITGSFVCNCATNAGTMDPSPLLFCASTAAIGVWNNDATLDGDDVVQFILHDQAGPSLGTVFATNAQPVFAFGPGLQTGVTYYISAIAGNSTPSGIDPGDPCFNVAPGTPVQWKPMPTATISGDASICRGSSTVLNISGTGIFPLNLAYNDGNGPMSWVIQNPQSTPITVSPLATTTYTLIVVDDGSLPTCSSFLNSSVTVTVNQPVNAGTALPPEVLCAGQSKLISLSSLLSGADIGGVWSETSANPSSAGAFNANSGSLNTNGQLAGTYTFRYALQATAPCQSQSTTVTVTIHPSPVADAGTDQLLDCFQDLAALGGAGTTQGPGIQYQWTSAGVTVNTSAQWSSDQAGVYTLLVSNAFGCTQTDLVNVIADNDIPNAGGMQVSNISCYGEQDGAIQLLSIQSNHPPVLFSLNGGPYGPNAQFQGLAAGTYTITLQDNKGCTWSTMPMTVTEPAPLSVGLGSEITVTFGDSVFLQANPSVPLTALESLQWNPVLDSLRAQTFTQRFLPFTSKSITLSLIDTFGCEAIARVLVKVKRPEEVYIPNIFHPGSELNDRLTVFGGPGVAEIESFRIFDRWGEQLFNILNFQPNDPSLGWDGAYRGEAVLPGVYVYFAVVRFIDGKTEVYRGDVTVLR